MYLCAALAATLCWTSVVAATTYHTVTVDGDLSDFATDELTAGDPLGDGLYGGNNDLGQLAVTWDATNLYLGFDYKAWGTAVLYLVETGQSGGATTLCPVSGYTGAFPTNVQGPGFDLMLGLFAPSDATAPVPYLYALTATGSTDITTSAGVEFKLKETVDTTSLQHTGGVELKLPWSTIYGLGGGKVPPGAKLKIAGVLRGELDGDGLGDVSPNPAGSVNLSACGSMTGNTLAAFHELTVDANSDGVPESGWSPGSNSGAPDAGVDTVPTPDLPPADVGLPDGPPDGSGLESSVDLGPADGATDRPAGEPAPDLPRTDGAVAGDGKSADEEGCACSAKGSSASASAALSLFLLGLVLVDRRRG